MSSFDFDVEDDYEQGREESGEYGGVYEEEFDEMKQVAFDYDDEDDEEMEDVVRDEQPSIHK